MTRLSKLTLIGSVLKNVGQAPRIDQILIWIRNC